MAEACCKMVAEEMSAKKVRWQIVGKIEMWTVKSYIYDVKCCFIGLASIRPHFRQFRLHCCSTIVCGSLSATHNTWLRCLFRSSCSTTRSNHTQSKECQSKRKLSQIGNKQRPSQKMSQRVVSGPRLESAWVFPHQNYRGGDNTYTPSFPFTSRCNLGIFSDILILKKQNYSSLFGCLFSYPFMQNASKVQ